MLLYLALSSMQVNPDADFERLVRAHALLQTGHVKASVSSSMGQSRKRASYELTYRRPSALRLRILTPATNGLEATDRIYFVGPTGLLAFDRAANQVLRRAAPKKGALLERAVIALGELDEALQILVEPAVMTSFLDQFRPLKGWRRTTSSGLLTLSHSVRARGKVSSVRFGIDAKSFLLRQVTVSSLAGNLDWTYSWGPPRAPVAPTPPADARLVVSFSDRASLKVQYANAEAKTLAEKTMRAYDNLRHFEAVVDGSQLRFSGQKLSEVRRDQSYAYDGQSLTLVDRRAKTVVTGRMPITSVRRKLAAYRVAMDPLLINLSLGENPVRQALTAGSRVRVAGSISDGGKACDILEVRTPILRLSLWIRRGDGLVNRITSDTLDQRGHAFHSTERVFRYVSLGTPLPGNAFRLSPPSGFAKKTFK